MKSFRLASLGAALLAAGVAQAASVELYGTVDTGLLYTHESVDVDDTVDGKTHASSDTWGMASGTNTASVIGIRGTENISDDLSVSFVLEHSFNSDDGSNAEESFFDKEAQVSLSSRYGTLSLTISARAIGWIVAYTTTRFPINRLNLRALRHSPSIRSEHRAAMQSPLVTKNATLL